MTGSARLGPARPSLTWFGPISGWTKFGRGSAQIAQGSPISHQLGQKCARIRQDRQHMQNVDRWTEAVSGHFSSFPRRTQAFAGERVGRHRHEARKHKSNPAGSLNRICREIRAVWNHPMEQSTTETQYKYTPPPRPAARFRRQSARPPLTCPPAWKPTIVRRRTAWAPFYSAGCSSRRRRRGHRCARAVRQSEHHILHGRRGRKTTYVCVCACV